jgi:hypothetical protein
MLQVRNEPPKNKDEIEITQYLNTEDIEITPKQDPIITPKNKDQIEITQYLNTEDINNIEKKVTHTLDELRNNNQSTEYIASNPKIHTKNDLSFEAKTTDIIMKSTIASLDQLGKRLDKDITKSHSLAVEWKSHINKLDSLIKNMGSYQKYVAWGACIMTTFFFLYKCGKLRAIPDFLSNMINITPNIIQDSHISYSDIKPEKIMHTLMETPLTPITLVSSIGVITISLLTLKTIVWVLQRTPK